MASTVWRDFCDGHHCCADWWTYSQNRKSQKFLVEMPGNVGERGMCNRSWIYTLLLTMLFAVQATTSIAQEAIGKATSVRPQAEGSHAGPLSGGSTVYSKETVRTGQADQAERLVRAALASGTDDSLLCLSGEIQFRRANFAEAARAYEAAIALNP